MSLAVVLSVLATTQVAIIGTSRLVFSMSRDKVLPRRLGVVNERFRTPAFGTILLGALTIVFGVVDIYQSSVANAIDDLIDVSGFLYASFYAITGLAATWYYRRLLGKSLKDALILGLLPLSGAALLIWVAMKGEEGLSSAERFILLAVGVLGLILMVVAATIYKAPIFQTKLESAKTDEATLRVGTD
jgi:amino acid transporter